MHHRGVALAALVLASGLAAAPHAWAQRRTIVLTSSPFSDECTTPWGEGHLDDEGHCQLGEVDAGLAHLGAPPPAPHHEARHVRVESPIGVYVAIGASLAVGIAAIGWWARRKPPAA